MSTGYRCRTVEEEMVWLDSLGLDAEEKIALLNTIMPIFSPEVQDVMRDTINAIQVEAYLLGNEGA